MYIYIYINSKKNNYDFVPDLESQAWAHSEIFPTGFVPMAVKSNVSSEI